MDKTLAEKKNCKQKKLVCVSSHLRTAHCTFTDESKLSVYVAFFRGPGECPADLTSASCLLLLRLAFLPRRPSPAELAPEAGSHGRHQTEAATFPVDGTFPRVCRVCREYSCSNCSDKVSNAKKITNKHLTAAHGGGVFFPTSTADAALKEAVDWLSTVSRFDVIRQMRLMLVTLLAEVALMSLLLVWRGLRALIL